MKTLKRLFLLVVLLAVVGGIFFRQSVYWSLWRLSEGLEKGDVATVEAYADLSALAKAPAHLAAAMSEEAAGRAGGDLLGKLVGAFVGTLGEEVAVASLDDLRRSIARGDFRDGVGPFVLDDSIPWSSPVQVFERTALVELRGRCEGTPTSLTVVFERSDDGPLGGYPSTWRLTGIDRGSLVALAKTCVASAQASGGAPPPAPTPTP